MLAMTYANIFAALADPTRREVFEGLWSGPQSVSDLATRVPVSRPAVSQHLKVLESAGLVQASQKGSHRIYTVRAEGLDALRGYLDRFWTEALSAFADEIALRKGPVQ